MTETTKKFKTKDMVICVFCTLLAILSIVFYFLPAFSVKHNNGSFGSEYNVNSFSAWEMTKAVFTNTKVLDTNMYYLLGIKDYYAFGVMLSGILMPLGIVCHICTTVFAYLSWLKNDKFKQYCFLFSLCGMMFTTVTLVSTWFIALQLKDGNYCDVFGANLKGSISYASFISLILAFVIAIIACAYNYFLDNFDEDEDEWEDEDEDESPRKAKATASVQGEEKDAQSVIAELQKEIDKLQREAGATVKEEEPKFLNKKVEEVETKPVTKKTTMAKSTTTKKTTSGTKSTSKTTTKKTTAPKKTTTGASKK